MNLKLILIAHKQQKLFLIGEQGYPVTNYEQLDDASWTITIQKA